MKRTVAALMAMTLLTHTGCRTRSEERAALSSQDYAMKIGGFDVPKPVDVPYSDAEDRAEYLRFYHAAYMTAANEREAFFAMNITPDSPRPQAAVDGWNDGFDDGTNAKSAYWRKRGVEPFASLTTQPAR